MKETAVARRYAKAFAELHNEPSSMKAISDQLKMFTEVFDESRQLRAVMLHPGVSPEEKAGVLKDILGKLEASDATLTILNHLLIKGRLPLIKLVTEEFEKISLESLGRVAVEVTTAVVISDSEKQLLKEKLTAISGKEAVIDLKVDPALIGGMVVRIGSVIYDGSIINQLKSLRAGLE